MNYQTLLDEKMKNFYDYILELIPKNQHDKLQSYEKMKENFNMLLVFIHKDSINSNINMFINYFGINQLTIEQHKKFTDYMEFFLTIKDKLFEN
jgi:hypothetical protein